MTVQYKFRSMDDLAAFFDELADRDRNAAKTARPRRADHLNVTGATWSSAANVVRNTTIDSKLPVPKQRAAQ